MLPDEECLMSPQLEDLMCLMISEGELVNRSSWASFHPNASVALIISSTLLSTISNLEH